MSGNYIIQFQTSLYRHPQPILVQAIMRRQVIHATASTLPGLALVEVPSGLRLAKLLQLPAPLVPQQI